MRNSLKVAKWEIIRNMKTKSYVIGLFLTPLLLIGFWSLSSLFGSNAESYETTVFVHDEIGVFELLEETVAGFDLEWELVESNMTEAEIEEDLENFEDTAYIFLTEEALEDGVIPVYTTDEIDPNFSTNVQLLAAPLQSVRMAQLDLSPEEIAVISSPIVFDATSADEFLSRLSNGSFFKDFAPGIFAGIILFSIVATGMMVFQSSSIEKKDKMAEIILSSVTPNELMNGKIIGYFVLGIIQVIVFLVFVAPFMIMKIEIPIIKYLLVPETLLFVFIAILGYLLFAAIFAGLGATLADMSTAGNFQGFIMMLPFISFAFAVPVFDDPSGLLAKVTTYIPFTSPGVLIMRLTMLEEWPWVEIIIALAVLILSIFLFMRLAGKIFKIGMLMYGKNATPGEIWKWIRS